MAEPFFTIGHSNRPFETFHALLAESSIAVVADVRRFPGSRSNPQFGQLGLADSLSEAGIDYLHFAALGGRRSGPSRVPPETNALWREPAFHSYADYALGADFRAALAGLRDLGHRQRCAIMCAEAVWWRCHRRIISDHLIAAGERVLHILGSGQVEEARLTEGARMGADGRVTYPPQDLLGPIAADDAPSPLPGR
jgi:uncharacterized protein (DUF488 family)